MRQLGIVAALLAALPASAVPAVDISMQAAFPSPPYLLELIETAAGENATAYYPILDKVANGYFNGISSDKDLYDAFLRLLSEDGYVTSPDMLSTFNFALSMRTAAPRVEAHYQYYATGIEPHLGTYASDKDCNVWALIDGQRYCSPDLALVKDKGTSIKGLQVTNLPFDRILGAGVPAVLYADISDPAFAPFHKAMVAAALNGEISYRLRHRRTALYGTPEPLPVNGYGVELSLKRTDYIVIDDRETDDQPAVKNTADDLQVVLDDDEEVADLKPLSKAELLNLGLSTTSYIMQSPNPFDTLVKVSQDFPKYSAKLAAHEIASEILEKRPKRDANTPAGRNMMWINGVQQIERQIEPFNLLEALRRERKLIQGVRSLGLNARQANALLGHNAITGSKISEDSIRYDWRDNLEGNRVIMWMNDLEKDPGYAQFDRSVRALLRQNFGQIPPIARNVFNLIVPIDFTNAADVSLAGQLWGLSQRELPIRFGIVPLLPSNTATEIGKVLYHLYHKYGFEVMLQYVSGAGMLGTLEIQKKVFDAVISGASSKAAGGADSPISLADVLAADSSNEQIEKTRSWIKRMEASSDVPPFLVNGVMMARTERWMQSMSQRLQIDLHLIQNAIREEALTDDGDPLEFYLQDAVLRRNKYINPSGEKDPRVLDVGKLYLDHKNLFDKIATIEPLEDTTKETWAAMTLVVDLTSDAGLQMLLNAFAFVEANDGVRLDIIHNPVETRGSSCVNEALLVNDPDAQNVNQLRDLLRPDGFATDESFDISLESFLLATNIQPGSSMVILNGRMIGPIADEDAFTKDDFQQFLLNERRVRIFPVYTAIDDLELGDIISSPLEVAKLTSITALSTISDLPQGIFDSVPTIRANIWDKWDDSYAFFEVGDAEESNVHVVVLLNPVSEQGQRWAGILKVLSELDGVYIKVFLNPSEKLTELPLKRFWRHVLASQPTFDAETGKVEKLHGLFKGLPSEALLNVKLDVPPLWLVAPKVSVHDLDNIKLSTAKGNVEAVYELQSILIEGHSRDGATTPPRGAQLVLATEKNPHQEDTIIMANIGYFQFKANPGFYSIQLLPGRSSDIFTIESVGAKGFRPVAGDQGTEVCVMSFQGKTLFPRLVRKPGMETADVLEVDDEGDSLLAKGKKLASGLGLFSSKSKGQEEQAEINIFSVASGHLYERMLSIMMVSVMKNTKHTVKFWFIEQFLSPSFKDFIPLLAEEYGFKYEMVAYKWPHWLRGQKEKQREIWGYKILFLDVLFPLSLDKVIFVDADQVVRTDMIDLVHVDLEGAPYGFTPMCDSRVEMEGFRFWKQGYWASYLRGKPYHISALYVVDLKQFRRLAAGDRLRQTYHSLSADPNSLSNLDQDLPNHMQFQLPIHSLSQDWLWCETWCSDESLKEARTIDLCNNPQTKEPKLDRARRQVPEWTQYDDEIAAVGRRRRGPATEEKRGAKTEEEEEQEPEAKNTNSRSWEEPPAVVTEKDEL